LALSSFSPLFIGEVPSTEIQSLLGRFGKHFSPLFIGEVPSTISRLKFSSQMLRFQSPLHRGSLLNPH